MCERRVEESDRMTRIVGDLLVLSRLDNNRTKWEISDFSVEAVIRHMCEVVKNDVAEHRHTLSVKLEDALPQACACDHRKPLL